MRADKRRILSRIMAAVFITMQLTVISAFTVFAGGGALYTNSDTGYSVYILDEENLLTDEEENRLLETMKELTQYGGAAFVSTSGSNSGQTVTDLSYELFHNDSSTLFLIDMGAREIKMANAGAVEKRVAKNYINIITDNVYAYASKGDYLTCARKAFEQEYTLLEGGRIAQPMRFLTNILTAVVLGLLLNFIYVWVKKGKTAVNDRELIAAAAGAAVTTAVTKTLVSSRKIRHESSSGGGFSGSSGGGGFSGGGGGFSGSSGGHKF